MADLTSSGVTILRKWVEGDRHGAMVGKVIEAQVTLTSMGSTTNTIPATAFGLSYVREVATAAADGAPFGAWQFVPSYDGTLIYAINLEQSSDATRGDPANATDVFRLVVKGK